MPHEMPAATRSQVFIVDDHPIVRQGLALLINREPDLTVCGDAEEAGSALQRIEEMKPDLVVVDISLNGPDGLDLLKDIRLHASEFAGPDSLHARRVVVCGALVARRAPAATS